jgi:hypothetical protein
MVFMVLKAIYWTFLGKEPWSSAVFFNLSSAEPRGSAKIFMGSAKFLTISSFIIIDQTKLLKFEQKGYVT